MALDKTVATPAEAVADVPDGASLAVGGFGQEEPRESVSDRHDGHAERGDHHEDAHERQVPALVSSDARADAADCSLLSAVPARVSDRVKEAVAGRALLVLGTGVCCTVRPTHHALPLDGIHTAWIDTTTQPKRRGAPIVGDPLNDP